MSPSLSSDRPVSWTARLVGAAASGMLELICFHPVDTVAKRLMANQTVSLRGLPLPDLMQRSAQVVFRDAVGRSAWQRYLSLFPGLGFAAGYKVLQRVYKFGGQPMIKDYLKQQHGSTFQRVFGERSAKSWMEATAGSLVGVGEIILLPLDVLKIKSQTNPETLRGRGLVQLMMNPRELYRGALWTAARNAPGSFALFGGNQVTKTYVLGLQDAEKPKFWQICVSSMVGSMASITVAAPLDVIKTRIQNRPFDSPESGMTILRRLVQQEGPSAFFKGLAPKLAIVGPKLIFSFTIAQWMIEQIHTRFD